MPHYLHYGFSSETNYIYSLIIELVHVLCVTLNFRYFTKQQISDQWCY